MSTLEDLTRRYAGRRIKTMKPEEETGKVAAMVLIGGVEGNAGPMAPVSSIGRIGFLVETDTGTMEVWQAGTLVPHRQLPVERTLLDDVRLGELDPDKFAEIVGVPLDIAESLIEAHEKKAAE